MTPSSSVKAYHGSGNPSPSLDDSLSSWLPPFPGPGITRSRASLAPLTVLHTDTARNTGGVLRVGQLPPTLAWSGRRPGLPQQPHLLPTCRPGTPAEPPPSPLVSSRAAAHPATPSDAARAPQGCAEPGRPQGRQEASGCAAATRYGGVRTPARCAAADLVVSARGRQKVVRRSTEGRQEVDRRSSEGRQEVDTVVPSDVYRTPAPGS